MKRDDLRDERIRILNSFHPEGPIMMSTDGKHECTIEETDESNRLAGAGHSKKICLDHQIRDDRRSGIERRCFSYTVYIPERRSGRERRGLVEDSLSSRQ